MSGIFKGIGKIFKKVVNVAKKVLPIALAVGAVVFTGGAALGVLPTFSAAIGGVVGGLGLGGAVGGALTGAITSAGFGAALGGLTGGMKGMQKGALMGAVTGGALGALNPATFGIVRGTDGMWTTANTIRTGSAFGAAGSGVEIAKGATGLWGQVGAAANPAASVPAGLNAAGALPPMAPGSSFSQAFQPLAQTPGQAINGGIGSATSAIGNAGGGLVQPMPTVATAMGSTMPTGGPAAGGGIGGFISQNPLIAGSMLQSVGGMLAGGDPNTAKQAQQARQKADELAYGGVYSKNSNPFAVTPYGPPPGGKWFYNPQTNAVEEVKA